MSQTKSLRSRQIQLQRNLSCTTYVLQVERSATTVNSTRRDHFASVLRINKPTGTTVDLLAIESVVTNSAHAQTWTHNCVSALIFVKNKVFLLVCQVAVPFIKNENKSLLVIVHDFAYQITNVAMASRGLGVKYEIR